MMKSNNANNSVALVTSMISGNIDHYDSCDRSLLVQSMCAGSSGSYVTEQVRVRRNLPKPPPPIKPATLRNKIAPRTIQNSIPLVSQLEVSTADGNLLKVLSNTSETTKHEEGNNCTTKIISEDVATESDASFEGMRITEEVKGVEGENESLISKSAQTSNYRATATNNRTSFINEEIKKPKMKPPPPPIQSRSSQSGRNSSKIETIRKKLNLEGIFCTDQNIMQNTVNDGGNVPSNFHRFERCIDDNWHIPSVPSIPPPLPPILSPQDSINDEMYEEIEQLTCDEQSDEIDKTKTIDYQINGQFVQDGNPDKSGQDESYTNEEEKKLNDSNSACSSGNHFGTMLQVPNKEKHYVKNNECNVRTNEKTVANEKKSEKTMKRPKSALEFDKLLRIKSDIQLNITKKVGQIKFKVSSASQERQRYKRFSSMLYTDREKLKDHRDDKVLAKIDFALDEQSIYEEAKNQSSKVVNVGKEMSNEPYSMLSEIERELRLRFQARDNLPDIVLESKRRSLSADQLLYDKKTTTKAENTSRSSFRHTQRHNEDKNYGICCQTKSGSLNPTADGYETVISSIQSSPEHNCLPSTSSDYTLKEIDRSIYTAKIIPDPQPLYQIYMMEQNGRLIYEAEEQEVIKPSFDGMNISTIQRATSSASTDSGRGADCSTTMSQLTSNTSMRRDRLVASSHFASQRSLWCELPEVRNAGLLEKLDEDAKKLQEAYFEVITSEASYLRSINILITHFMAAPEMLGSKRPSSVITNEERKQLFSNIFAVRDCSEKLLSDLENRLQESLVLSDVCDILCDHFETNFDSYIKYCSNQVYQDRTLRRLKSENSSFLSCIQRLENDRLCQGLDMRSFLMLPMQRVTRYPLLLIAILEHTQQDSTNYQTAQIALHLANRIVTYCNEGARHMERIEQLLEIERRLVYKSSDLRRIPLVSSGRYLVKRGSLMCLNEKHAKKLLHTRHQFQNIYIFLFSDIIMLTKKKINGTYICKDYSARRFVDIEPVEINDPKLLQSVIAHIPLKKPHLFICTLMHNAVGKQVELLLNADSETDRERWLSALRPPACSNPKEKIYADWDCPQAVAVHRYSPDQEDELPLEKGDLINILRKMPDGWFYGERVRDWYGGWFPSSYVQQVLNDHVRAKNYRQRLRVIQAAADFRFCQTQMKIGTEENACHLMERFRRLSNTKNMLNDLKSNQI
uniref:Uncharacterized protein n=1 Tax=Onchocerca volvulus TaxID=6282 RepID=A0A8R1TK75_ONCVO